MYKEDLALDNPQGLIPINPFNPICKHSFMGLVDYLQTTFHSVYVSNFEGIYLYGDETRIEYSTGKHT